MPDGPHDDPSIDFFILRHTSEGQPRFHTHKQASGIVSIHADHADHADPPRVEADEPRWDALNLTALLPPRAARPTRAEADAIAAELLAKVKALRSSSPSAFLAIDGWCVAIGNMHVYTRAPGCWFARVVPPVGGIGEDVAARVVDLDPVKEWIATTAPLQDHALWREIERSPLDSVESGGSLLRAVRALAVEHGKDHVVIRGRRPRVATPEVVQASDDIGGELRVVWGAEMGRPYFVFEESLIGRGKDCDIQLDDDGVSRQHARITRVEGRYVLRDLDSTNGVYVHGKPTKEHPLGDGDLVWIGAHRFQFWYGHRTIWEPHVAPHDDRRILAALAEDLALANAGEREIALVLVDLDRLHRLNVEHGYPVGDAVLAHVESVARAALRAEDTLARIGGDDFGIVLPGLGLAAARQVAEDVRRAVHEASYVHEGREVPMTLSCGVAAWSSRVKRPWQLLREAEARLQEAKAGGRDRVR